MGYIYSFFVLKIFVVNEKILLIYNYLQYIIMTTNSKLNLSEYMLSHKAIEPLNEYAINEIKRIQNLDVTNFTEADVRAEIIDPIVRILGYQKGQFSSVDREKYISFYNGEKKKKQFIDYNFTLWQKSFWIIEAKAPQQNKDSFEFNDLFQVVKYAVHPEINAAIVVLCDGCKIEVFDREEDLNAPLFRIKIPNLLEEFENLTKLLSPMQIWFFHKRRVIRTIDKAFEDEINQNRVNEFKELIISRLAEKRTAILKNFQKTKINDENKYEQQLNVASLDELVDIHFFFSHPLSYINTITSRLLDECENKGTFRVLHKMFPNEVRCTNDYYYMNALAVLIELEKSGIRIDWLPTWLTNDQKDINLAIKNLISFCLSYFKKDETRKVILLSFNSFRRIFKILGIIRPEQWKAANFQHLITRYNSPEFSLIQMLSSPEHNMLMKLDDFAISATDEFVRSFHGKNNKFNHQLAKQQLRELWKLEKVMIEATDNYHELLSERSLGELHPIENSSIIHDDLGHGCLCLIKEYPKWKNYILTKHRQDVQVLASIGSWAAEELLGVEKMQPFTKSEINNMQVSIDRFFFGDTEMFIELIGVHNFTRRKP